MRLIITLLWIQLALMSHALANEVLTVDLSREANGKPVVISAWVESPAKPNGKALLIFPGWPGIPRIEQVMGRPSFMYLQEHVQEMAPTLHAAGITTVTVDCPTDQWGVRGSNPTACDDNYRSSPQHAQDVAALISQLKASKAIQHITIMGHSYGAVSSHWLSLRLNRGEIQGAIHSASQTIAGSGPYQNYASSLTRFPHAEVSVPYFYLHHRDDLCSFTPYNYAKKHAPEGRLITVLGGNKWTAPCGKASYHGYADRRAQVADALVALINRSEVIATVKGEQD
ncbi:MAG: hypothetical protein RIT44_2119 [Pseudomonadota bacterium]|jgi:hypothetical protein